MEFLRWEDLDDLDFLDEPVVRMDADGVWLEDRHA